MNRHFYGPDHGPPSTMLEEQGRPIYHSDGCVESLSQQARIIEDQLIARSTIAMWHSKGHAKSLRKRIDALGHYVCKHLSLKEDYFVSGPVQLAELVKDKQGNCELQLHDHALGSCTICATDYSLTISWHGEKTGYFVEVQIYRRLGDCRSPSGWAWKTVSTARADEELRIAREPTSGSVRVLWSRAQDRGPWDYGKWIEIPLLTSNVMKTL